MKTIVKYLTIALKYTAYVVLLLDIITFAKTKIETFEAARKQKEVDDIIIP